MSKRIWGALLVIVLVAATSAGSINAAPSVAAPTPREQVDALQRFWQSGYGQGIESQLQGGLLGRPLANDLLAKAQPDECFNGIGNPYPPGPPCAEGVPKVNQAYVWGLAKSGTSLWFGTAPNVHCAVLSGYLTFISPHETPAWVCEFGESQYSPPLPPALGDWRPPHIYVYDTATGTLADKTPAIPLLALTGGLRSAGTLGDVVILGGPGLQGGINLFAFDTGTGNLLGATNLPQYTNIRKWIAVDGVLYTAVQGAAGGGHVLRWRGDAANPFEFEIVGNLDSQGAELALHEGRLFVTTWPDIQAVPPALAGLFMSPEIPPGGLTADAAAGWQKVWQASDYEPDPVTAATYGGGALASFDGKLYWGTMHVPVVATFAHFTLYGVPEDPLDIVATVLGTWRAISIFRGSGFGGPDQNVELLYGHAMLPAYDLAAGWQIVPNNMGGQQPLWGLSGFYNFFNNYTWTMAAFEDQLYVGTMDWSYLFKEGLPIFLAPYLSDTSVLDSVEWPVATYGADLWRFPSGAFPALPVSITGVGNWSNYGIRTMVADDALYLGTANPMNLLTNPDDDLPEGGWELRRLGTGQTTHVEAIEALLDSSKKNEVLDMAVHVRDRNGNPVEGVRVLASIQVPDGKSFSRVSRTSADGIAQFEARSKASGSWALCVDDLQLQGYIYQPANNAITCQDWEY